MSTQRGYVPGEQRTDMRGINPTSCSNGVVRDMGRYVARRCQNLGEVRTPAEAFLWSYETRLPVASGPFLVCHVDNGNCSLLLGGSAGLEVGFVPVQGCINGVATNDCYAKFVPTTFSWVEVELGRVRI